MHIKNTLRQVAIILLVTNMQNLKAQITAFPDTTICSGEMVTLYSDASEFCGDCYTSEEIPFEPEAIGGTSLIVQLISVLIFVFLEIPSPSFIYAQMAGLVLMNPN